MTQKVTRTAINDRILSLRTAGKTAKEIASILRSEGIKTKTGLVFTDKAVFNTLNLAKLKAKRVRPIKGLSHAVIPSSSNPADTVTLVAEILTSGMTKETKRVLISHLI